MAKPITIPNTFASATSAIPLSQLDQDFSTLANSTNDLATYSNYVADTGAADAFIANYPANTNTSSLTTGLRLQFKAANANTGASTLNVQVNGASIGTASIRLTDGSALPANTIIAGALVDVMYDGTNFQIMNDPSGGQEIISNLTLSGNLTVAGTSTFTGNVTGNVVNTTTSTITNLTSSNVTITGGSIDNISITNLTSLTVDGNTTLGDASGDTLTITGTTVTTPNGLNFDSNTLVIDAANNRVGVGTSTPANKLEIRQASNGKAWSADGDDVFAVENSGSTNIDIRSADNGGNYILFSDASARAVGWILYNHNTDSLAFRTNSAERMRIDSSGNVGIGTSSPPTFTNYVTVGINATTGSILNLAAGGTSYGRFQASASEVGLYQLTANPMVFYTNTTERMRITSTGNVGIGTSSASVKLQINEASNGATTETLRLTNTGTGANTKTRINFYAASTNYGSITGGYGASAPEMVFDINTNNGAFIWNSNSTERMRIDSSGNVGIGTSSPTDTINFGRIIDVSSSSLAGGTYYRNSGTGYFGAVGYDGTFGYLGTWGASAGAVRFYTNSTEKMRLDTSGNLGLGVTPSAWNSSVKAIDLPTNGYVAAANYLGITANAYEASGGTLTYRTTDFANLYQQYNGVHSWHNAPSGTAGNTITFTQAMTLDASGRLLIGNTASNAAFAGKLQVEGTSDAFVSFVRYSSNAAGAPGLYLARSKSATLGTNTIVASGDTLGTILFSGANGTGYSDAAYIQCLVDGTPGASNDMPGRLAFFTSADGSATPTERMRIDSSGNVQIGNTSTSAASERLNVNGFAGFGDRAATNPFVLVGNTGSGAGVVGTYSNHALEFRTNNSERMRITSGGDVLVGKTTSSSYPLQAKGAGLDGSTTVSVSSGVTTTIYTSPQNTTAMLCVVFGDNGSEGFCDLVIFLSNVTPVVTSSNTVYGSPPARTYSNASTNQLRLNVGMGASVRVAVLGTCST